MARRTAEYAQANEKLTAEIMEHQKTEEGLRFRAMILDNLSEAIFLTNLKGEFVYSNNAACELFGYSCDEILNMNLLDLLQLLEASKNELMENLLKTGQIELKTIHVRKDKSTAPILLRSSLVKIVHGKIVISVVRKN